MDHGFAGARVDAIARRARANKAMIYYHFGTKEGLYQSVVAELFADVQEQMERHATGAADPRSRLLRLYQGLDAAFRERPALPRIILREILSGGRSLGERTARALVGIVELVRQTLARGVEQGVFRPVNALSLHMTAVGTLLLFHVSDVFRTRLVALAPPPFAPPSADEILAHLEQVLERTLDPRHRLPATRARTAARRSKRSSR
jgi:AcrR family transcriptional regulator